MLRKILKVFLVIVFIGFISAYVRGIHYNSNKLKNDKSVAQENIETKKQNIIDEELISSIINDSESKEEVKENNTSNNKVINNQNEVKNCYSIGECTYKCLIRKTDYTASHIFNCFSEKNFVDKITLSGTVDDISEIFESGYMKTNEFLKYLNDDNVWIRDTTNINNGYPILKWQVDQ